MKNVKIAERGVRVRPFQVLDVPMGSVQLVQHSFDECEKIVYHAMFEIVIRKNPTTFVPFRIESSIFGEYPYRVAYEAVEALSKW